jgi:general secretion pathway protein F
MPQFTYLARTEAGAKVSGDLGASSRRDALTALIGKNLTPIRLQQQEPSVATRRAVKPAAVESCFEMLSDLLASGIPLAQAMDVLCRRTTDGTLNHVLHTIRDDVIDGATLSDAMGRHPEVFRPLVISLIHAGEQGGFLEQSLAQLAELTRRQQELTGRLLGALAYPALLIVVGIAVMMGMMLFFVPRFEPLFERMAATGELPVATATLLSASDLLRNYGLIVALTLAVIVTAVVVSTDRADRQRYGDRLRMRLPVIGPIVVNLAIVRFARLLGTTLQGGVPIVQALQIARHSLGNRLLADAILQASHNIQAGRSLTEPLRASGLFPLEIVEMISVGEHSNRLEKVLLGIADRLESKTQRRLDTLVKMLEPAMMVVMACLVGFMIVALLLPVFNSAGRFQ